MANQCCWMMRDIECAGEVSEQLILRQQVKIPMCQAHQTAHKVIMFLHSIGVDVEEAMTMTHEQRMAEVQKAVVAGNDFDNFNDI